MDSRSGYLPDEITAPDAYQLIGELTSDFAYSFAVDGQSLKLQWLTDGFTKVTGFSPTEIDERGGWLSLVHPDSAGSEAAGLATLLSGAPLTSELEIVTRSGSSRWIRALSQPVRDDRDEVICIFGVAQDVTEEKQAQRLLSERERLLAQAESLARVGSGEWDPVTGKVTCSDELYRMLGLDAEDHPSTFEDWLQLIHPDDRAEARQAALEAARTGEPFELSFRVIDAGTGDVRTLQARGGSETGPDEQPRRVFAVVLDVTERLAAQRALTQEASRSRLLSSIARASNASATIEAALEVALEDICSFTGWEVGHCFLLDPAKSRALGSSDVWFQSGGVDVARFRAATEETPFFVPEGLPGRVVSEGAFVSVPEIAGYHSLSRREAALACGLRSAHAFPLLTGDEVVGVLEFFSLRPTEVDAEIEALMNTVGAQLGRVLERQRATALLEESEERFRSLADSALDAIVSADERGTIWYANPATEQVFGYLPEELVGKPLTMLMPERFRKAYTAGLEAFVRVGSGQTMGNVLQQIGLRKDGSEFPVEIALSHRRTSGGIVFTSMIRDISERQRAAEELAAHASLLEATLEATADGILAIAADGHVLATNKRFWDMWEVPAELVDTGRDELLDHIQRQVVDPTYAERARAYRQNPSAPRFETIELIDGRIYERFQNPCSLGPHRKGAVISYRDVTEAHDRQARLAEAQALAHIGSWEVDLKTRRLVSSDQWRSIFAVPEGVDPTQYLFWDRIHPDDRDELRATTRQEQEKGGRFEHSYRIVRPDGSVRWIESTGRVESDPDGLAIRVVGADQDVTERKRAERLLACQAEVLQKVAVREPLGDVLESIAHGIERETVGVRCSILLVEDGLLRHGAAPSLPDSFNEAVDGLEVGEAAGSCGTAAFRGEEVVSADIATDPLCSDFADLVADYGLAASWSSPILSERREVIGTFALYYRTPREPSALERELVGVFSSLASIAVERHRAERAAAELEAQYRQAQKMQAVGQLAGGIAHDFNNLLQAILTSGHQLLDLVAPGDPGRAHVETVLAGADKAAALVRQLLTFARREPLAPQVVDLNAAIEEMTPLIRATVGDSIELGFTLDPAAPSVEIDPGSLEQILMNLVGNARDSTGPGGRVWIETIADLPNVTSRNENLVALVVSDDGPGIEPEVEARMFEPFFTTKGPGEGSGLGLASVYGAVEAAGGHIQMKSAPGACTSFFLYFPARAAGEVDPPVEVDLARPGHTTGRGSTILLAEDEAIVAENLRKVLTRRGYRVLTALDGADALETALSDSFPIDLVITDVVMPTMSGPEVVRRLRKAGRSFRVLYMSGYSEEVLDRRDLSPGGDAYIAKPFSPHELTVAVEMLLVGPG